MDGNVCQRCIDINTIHNSQITRYFAIKFFHRVHFSNHNNIPGFPGIDTRLHTRFLHNVSCTSSRLPCNSRMRYTSFRFYQ